jgi:hypothetical protein
MVHWKAPRIWPGSDVIIIGGGPSFASVDRTVLKDLSLRGRIRVIGINKAFKVIPGSGEWMHVLWFGDDRFYKVFSRRKDGIYTFPGLRVGCCPAVERDKAVKFLGRDRKHGHGITSNPSLVCWNKNSGGSAINLAYHLSGPGSRCFLFGYDMQRDDNDGRRTHWHEGYPELRPTNKDPEVPFNRWLATFPSIVWDAKLLKFYIYNVNPKSAIQEFPKITFSQFLEMVVAKEQQEQVASSEKECEEKVS